MKFTEISKFSKEDTDKKYHELRTELMKLNAQVATGTTPKSTKKIREIKRTLAKIQTFRQQKLKKELTELSKGLKKNVSRRYIHS